MKYTFKSDDCMVITIPLGGLRDAQEGQLMPEKFHCVFKDTYKVFLRRQPKALGAAQLIVGVLVLILGMLVFQRSPFTLCYTVPSVLSLVYCPMVQAILQTCVWTAFRLPSSSLQSLNALCSPLCRELLGDRNAAKAKLSLSLNIISFFWSAGTVAICAIHIFIRISVESDNVLGGVRGMIAALLVAEMMIALVLIYSLSKAICRPHFNTVPVIMLKQEVRI